MRRGGEQKEQRARLREAQTHYYVRRVRQCDLGVRSEEGDAIDEEGKGFIKYSL